MGLKLELDSVDIRSMEPELKLLVEKALVDALAERGPDLAKAIITEALRGKEGRYSSSYSGKPESVVTKIVRSAVLAEIEKQTKEWLEGNRDWILVLISAAIEKSGLLTPEKLAEAFLISLASMKFSGTLAQEKKANNEDEIEEDE